MINFLKWKSRWGFERCEDSMTSLIFESLSMFEPSDIWAILKESCLIDISLNPGKLKEIDFWPKWNADGEQNTRYVEPDVYMDYDNIKIIFEVKKPENASQDSNQWRKEIKAFRKKYPQNNVEVILIAINGNSSFIKENEEGVNVYKTSWGRLCDAALKRKDVLSDYKRKWLVYAFDIIGVAPYSAIISWLDEINDLRIDPNAISFINTKTFLLTINHAIYRFHK